MTEEIKRHEYKLPLANWLRDEINEVLSRYDVPSDVYERDISIDAVCVVAVDKMERSLAETLDSKVVALEAKLAKAMKGLEESQEEIDNYIRWEYPSDHPVHERYRKRDYAANPARATLAELTGGKDD